MVLTPGALSAATGMSLMPLTERVHSDGATPPRRNISFADGTNRKIICQEVAHRVGHIVDDSLVATPVQ